MWGAGSCRPLAFGAISPLLELLSSSGLLECTVGTRGLHRFRVGDVSVGRGEIPKEGLLSNLNRLGFASVSSILGRRARGFISGTSSPSDSVTGMSLPELLSPLALLEC